MLIFSPGHCWNNSPPGTSPVPPLSTGGKSYLLGPTGRLAPTFAIIDLNFK